MNDAEKAEKLNGYVRKVRDDKVSRLVEIIEVIKAGETDDKLFEEADQIGLFLEAYDNNVTPALKAVQAAAESGDEEEVSLRRDELFDELDKLDSLDDDMKLMFEKFINKVVTLEERVNVIEEKLAASDKSEAKPNVDVKKETDKSSKQPAPERVATDENKSKSNLLGRFSSVFKDGQFLGTQLPNRDAANAA